MDEVDSAAQADPGDVVGVPIGFLAGLVVADQLADDIGLRGIGLLRSQLQVRNRAVQKLRVATGGNLAVGRSGAIDLFDQAAALLDQSRIQLVFLRKSCHFGAGHAGIEIVGAGGELVLPRRRGLHGKHGLVVGVEDGTREPVQQGVERLWGISTEIGAILESAMRGGLQFGGRELGHKFSRAVEIVVAVLYPDELGVAANFRQRSRINAVRVGPDAFEELLQLQTVV